MGRTKRDHKICVKTEIVKEKDKSTKKKRRVTGWVLNSKKFNHENLGIYKTKEALEKHQKILFRPKSKNLMKVKITIEEI